MIINFDPEFIDAAKSLKGVVHIHGKGRLSADHYANAEGLVIRLGISLDGRFLSKFKKLIFIATITTGLDHIDLAWCARNNVKVISLTGETGFLKGIRATPEFTWALVLSLYRRLPWAFESVLEGSWDRKGHFGNDLYNKKLGIIGYGRVGRIVARYAAAFGMTVMVYDVNNKRYGGVKIIPKPLRELLRAADIISVHLPLNEGTGRFIRKEHFGMMKKSAVLINTSRGKVIDEQALLEALKKKRIAGAALDVLEGENIKGAISKKHPLISYARTHKGLIITPHIAGSSRESMRKTAVFIAGKIKDFLNKT